MQRSLGQRQGDHNGLLLSPARRELRVGIPAVQRTAGNRAVAQLLAGGTSPTAVGVQRERQQSQYGGGYESDEAKSRAAEIEKKEVEALDPPERSSDVKYYLTVLPPALSVAQGEGIPLESTLMMLAQAQVEHSKSIPPGNMIFGITTASDDPSQYVRVPTNEVRNGKLVREEGRKFRKYASPEDSVRGYLKLLGGKDPEHDLYKKNKGQPLTILKESGNRGAADRATRFRRAVVGGGYSTNPNGFCTNVGTKEKPIFRYSKGYNQLYPLVFNQILKELRGKADIVTKVTSDLRTEADMLDEVTSAYDQLATELEANVTESSEETEKIRRDAGKLRTRSADLRTRVEKTRETLKRLEEFRNKIQGVQPAVVPSDWRCTADGKGVVP